MEFSRFAKRHGVAWGIAETGHTHASAQADPQWVLHNYMTLLKHGGIAFTYFNSTLNSTAPWNLVGEKEQEFARVLRMTPTL